MVMWTLELSFLLLFLRFCKTSFLCLPGYNILFHSYASPPHPPVGFQISQGVCCPSHLPLLLLKWNSCHYLVCQGLAEACMSLLSVGLLYSGLRSSCWLVQLRFSTVCLQLSCVHTFSCRLPVWDLSVPTTPSP